MSGPMCERAGCNRPAVCVLACDIPAKGHAFDLTKTAKFCFGMKMCLQHFRVVNPKEMFIDETKATINDAFSALGRAAPDFKRMRKARMALDDPMVLDLEKRAAEKAKQIN